MEKRRGFGVVAVLLMVAMLVAAGGIFYILRTSIPAPRTMPQGTGGVTAHPTSTSGNPSSATPTTTTTSVSVVPLKWKTCRNENFQFQFSYPSDWVPYFLSDSQGAADRSSQMISSCTDASNIGVAIAPKNSTTNTGIYVDVCDMVCMQESIYKNAKTLDGYLAMSPWETKGNPVLTRGVFGGQPSAVLRDGGILLFYSGQKYTIFLYPSNGSTTNAAITQSFNFFPSMNKFSGPVSDIRDERAYDGNLSMKIGDKWIVVDEGGLVPPGVTIPPKGEVVGIDLQHPEDSIGKTVFVFATPISPSQPNTFTLDGNTQYYMVEIQ